MKLYVIFLTTLFFVGACSDSDSTENQNRTRSTNTTSNQNNTTTSASTMNSSTSSSPGTSQTSSSTSTMSSATASTSVTLTTNSDLPSIANLRISPQIPAPGLAVRCEYEFNATSTAQDQSTIQWRVDGAVVQGQAGPTLSGDAFERGQKIACEVTPNDGVKQGTPKLTSVHAASLRAVEIPEKEDYPLGSVTEFKGLMYFSATHETKGVELWVSDGTKVGTRLFKDINPSSENSIPNTLVEMGGKLYFVARSVLGRGLWVTDGTEEGTKLVSKKTLGVAGLTKNKDTLFFLNYDNMHGYELWKSDGTENGTTLIKDINPGSEDGIVDADSIFYKERIYLNTSYGRLEDPSLSSSDGTEGGTVKLAEFKDNLNAHDFQIYKELLYFIVGRRELWVTDGTKVGTREVQELPEASLDYLDDLKVIQDSLYWYTGDRQDQALWKSDGTKTGTTPFLQQALQSDLRKLSMPFEYNGFLYFRAETTATGSELWRADPQTGSQQLVRDLRQGTMGSNPDNFTTLGGLMYFSADTADKGRELWVTDGQDVVLFDAFEQIAERGFYEINLVTETQIWMEAGNSNRDYELYIIE